MFGHLLNGHKKNALIITIRTSLPVVPPIFTNSLHHLPHSVRLLVARDTAAVVTSACLVVAYLLMLSVRSSKVIFKRVHLPHFHQQRLSIKYHPIYFSFSTHFYKFGIILPFSVLKCNLNIRNHAITLSTKSFARCRICSIHSASVVCKSDSKAVIEPSTL